MKGPEVPDNAKQDESSCIIGHANGSPYSHGDLLPSERGGSWEGGHPFPFGARRNGRAFASLTARGGGLPIGVTLSHSVGSVGNSSVSASSRTPNIALEPTADSLRSCVAPAIGGGSPRALGGSTTNANAREVLCKPGSLVE